ncbi:hypothetical protein BGW80DRAFT_178610 [Lactifluus volemus]|nr:hypothetical protein BGW80DRAFT_178610 [Lactifluus volemus]
MRLRSSPGFATMALAYLQAVFGALYVVEPNAQTVCHGGEPCVVQWLDDGVKPLLADMGPCYVALFSGNQRLIQQIEPIDVSTNHSLTFTPNRIAGPNSNTYYVEFSSINLSNASLAYSPNFSMDQMKGSFESPVAELTSTIPVPSSVLSEHLYPVSTSILSEAIPVSTLTSSSYRSIPSSSSAPASSSTTTTATATIPPSSNAAMQHFSRFWVIILVASSFHLYISLLSL